MDALLWIIGIVIAAPVVWWLLSAIVGGLVPAKVTGRIYLRKQLTQMGVEPERVPDACLDELVRISEIAARMRVSGEGFSTEFVRSLEGMAYTVIEWLRNPNDPSFDSIGGEEDIYRQIFTRHSVK